MEILGARADRLRIGVDVHHHLLELLDRGIEVAADFLVFAGKGLGEPEGQIAVREPLQGFGDRRDEDVMRLDILLRLDLLAGTIGLGRLARRFGFGLEPRLFDRIVLEHLDALRHFGDLVAFAQRRNADVEASLRQPLHAIVEDADRKGDAALQLVAGVAGNEQCNEAADDLGEMDEPEGAALRAFGCRQYRFSLGARIGAGGVNLLHRLDAGRRFGDGRRLRRVLRIAAELHFGIADLALPGCVGGGEPVDRGGHLGIVTGFGASGGDVFAERFRRGVVKLAKTRLVVGQKIAAAGAAEVVLSSQRLVDVIDQPEGGIARLDRPFGMMDGDLDDHRCHRHDAENGGECDNELF